ncbi:MAG: S-adenosylmethionine:tRNA ribosyltransferase-isomerase [Chitinophagaceae bacterium]|jgi:S-adenosylmethionine:tRNA ribosyltransferase-isomerase|nr:S-adenosylmethionine:tRNA ribosyltransferase-isomerase [Chitinophagaceae bacterium]
MNTSLHPGHIGIEKFDYELPDERVAKFPLENRDASKLLLYNNGSIGETIFKNLTGQLAQGSLLVFNNSRVVEARLLFQKESGGLIEIFALEPHEKYADITTALNSTGSITYKCLIGGASKWKHGMVLQKRVEHNGEVLTIQASIAGRRPDCFDIEFSWNPSEISFAQVLHEAGKIPIPPYLHRESEEIDNERYQNVYATAEGSVAAPTAGLHFTQELLNEIEAKGIQKEFVTLHVGAGTFMPVKAQTMQDHEMHAEFLEINISLIDSLLANETIIPVGTTAMRTLESLYWMGVKAYYQPAISLADLEIRQWEVYDYWMEKNCGKEAALHALKAWMQQAGLRHLVIRTRIIIAPGYKFGMCRGLITNFHQPKSTLLLLVAALIGDDWKKVYDYALSHDFRFLSYGDSSLILPLPENILE